VDGHLLVVHQPGSGSIDRLRDHVLTGLEEGREPEREVVALAAPEAGVDAVEGAVGVVLVTSERFGAVAGLMKDLLERIYPWFEEVPNRRPGMPYLLVAKGGNDGTGAVRDVTRILTGLRWNEALPPVVVSGDVTDEHLASVREAAATLAAGIDAGMW
jgi:NAD(P)H-dependent FMN reductase